MNININKTENPGGGSKTYKLLEINLSSLSSMFLVLFVGLKLCHVIDWSWWWVLSPLWLPWVALAAAWGIIWIMSRLLLGKNGKYYR